VWGEAPPSLPQPGPRNRWFYPPRRGRTPRPRRSRGGSPAGCDAPCIVPALITLLGGVRRLRRHGCGLPLASARSLLLTCCGSPPESRQVGSQEGRPCGHVRPLAAHAAAGLDTDRLAEPSDAESVGMPACAPDGRPPRRLHEQDAPHPLAKDRHGRVPESLKADP